MNVKIGSIIKKLRTENNITQDTLATAIGVTPQAISRWESEGGYPDIELLPLLADFFSVSTDELLGYKLSEREEQLTDIKMEMERLAEVGSIEERVAYARNAYARYPNDYDVRDNLAVCLYHVWQETHDEVLFKEIESLLESVANECNDENERYDAINILIILYGEVKQYEKAKEWVNRLTPMKYRRETALSGGIGDGKTKF
ncbi:MAG: helix-turn-helix transcriptional regulator, partial [Clostridia bacterium]|nr:helix-turn-helix transcriptional regulator [Clostridia bacterium]